MKKYKLVMPETMTLEQHIDLMKHGLENLYKSNGDSECIEENETGVNWNEHIPKEWLHEVKEPVTADQWMTSIAGTGKIWSLIEAFQAGEKNQKLRHREKVNKETAYNRGGSLFSMGHSEIFEKGWNECKKSHGLDCE